MPMEGLMRTLSVDQTKNLLTHLSPGSTIELTKLLTGEIIVVTSNGNGLKTKEDILKEKYPYLIGQAITVTEASDKYNIPRSTLQSWIYRSGYIHIVDVDSYPQKVDEAEVAYCAEIYRQRRAQGSKAPLLDEKGLPYELKHPSLSNLRRRKKQQV